MACSKTHINSISTITYPTAVHSNNSQPLSSEHSSQSTSNPHANHESACRKPKFKLCASVHRASRDFRGAQPIPILATSLPVPAGKRGGHWSHGPGVETVVILWRPLMGVSPQLVSIACGHLRRETRLAACWGGRRVCWRFSRSRIGRGERCHRMVWPRGTHVFIDIGKY